MTTLVNKLNSSLETLKNQFINESCEWAKKDFVSIGKKVNDIENRLANNYYTVSNKEYRADISFLTKGRKFLKGGLDNYIEFIKNDSLKKFDNSIIKLAKRISKKELNLDKLNIESSHIDVNINCIITDGNKKVKAQTILACGEIVRPHYRFLVK